MTNADQPIVVVDPGHGGSEKRGGSSPNNATGPNGLVEKDLALDVARRLATALSGRARVILTRATDVNLSLADRAAVARSNHADVFLSIHFNGYRDPAVDGTEVWVARQASQASVDLAHSVQQQLLAVTHVPDRGIRRADWGVLVPGRHDPHTAACLAEIAFLTNPAEAGRLADDHYRQQIAEALATAVLSRVLAPVAAGAPVTSAPATSHGLGMTVAARQSWQTPRVYPATYARTAAIVTPDVDYSIGNLPDAVAAWVDWLARYAQWTKGVPDELLTRFPHAAICQLKLHTAAGDLAYGTGFYIERETLLTCGHNFMDSDGWVTTSVEVQPGHSPTASTLAAASFNVSARDIVHPSWRDSFDNTKDLAVLRVPGLAATAGVFSLANVSLAPSAGIVVCGYGKVDGIDFEAQGQRMDGAHISEADFDMVYYPIQTIGGHSGSPVFHNDMVIGVHTGPRMRGTGTDPHQNRGVLLNPDKEDWIRSMMPSTVGAQALAGNGHRNGSAATWPRAYALVDENSSQSDQSLEVRRHIANSMGDAETNNRYDLLGYDSQRVNFGIGSWTGGEIADLLDVYDRVASANGTSQTLYNYFGGQANFTALRDRFRQNGAATTISSAEETSLRQMGRDTSLQDAQVQKLADDVKTYLDDIGSRGNPWYPWIDGGMGAISEVAAHVLTHARHQAGGAGLRQVLTAAINHFGGEQQLGQQMVNGQVSEMDFLRQVGEEVTARVQPQYQNGVRRRYQNLLNNWGSSRLSYYFNPSS